MICFIIGTGKICWILMERIHSWLVDHDKQGFVMSCDIVSLFFFFNTVKLRMLITGTSLTHLFVTIEFSLLYRQANHWDLSISIGTLPFYIKQPRRIDRRHRVARSQERDSFWRERLVGLCFITKQLLEECRALAETFPRCVLLKS